MRIPPLPPSAVVLAGRILLLGIASGAVALGFLMTRTARDPSLVAAVSYACPMHPQVTSASPGDCPICRMALEPVTAHPEPTVDHAATTEAPAGESSSGTLTLPPGSALHRFDALSRVKRYELALEMRATAWAESAEVGVALLHLDEQELLKPNEEAIFFPSGRPKDGSPPGIKVHVTSEPPLRWDRATTMVRFRADAGAKLTPGKTGSIKFSARLRTGLVVRASAVLDSPEGPYVLVVADDRRTLTKRAIEIGNVVYGYAAVVSGLRENEKVAATHTAFLDAERRLRGGAL